MVQKRNFYEGFWKSKEEPNYPEPISNDTVWFKNNKKLIISKLEKIQSIVKPKAYKGSSFCRRCGCKNGSEEYSIATPDNAKVIWTWPSGYIHYIQEHDVCPTSDFLKDILSIDRQDTESAKETILRLWNILSKEEEQEVLDFINKN